MGRFDGILLMSDFDGTMSPWNERISEENKAAIRRFEQEGGRFCIASGRIVASVREYAEAVPIKGYCVALNGAIVYDPEKNENVLKMPLDREKMLAFIKLLIKECPNYIMIRLHTEAVTYRVMPDMDIEAEFERICEPFYKFLWEIPDELSDEYLERIGRLAGDDFYVSRSCSFLIEIQAKGASKGDAISHLKALYGGKIHTVVAVGDYENDIDMIKKADIGYAVANAVPELAAVADRHTVDCREHAIAAIINEL